MSENFKFTIGGGAVQIQGGTYLFRPADNDLFDLCKQGEIAYVLACRQIGKSSLMNQTASRLKEQGFKTAVVDLSGIGKIRDADNWYYNLIDELTHRLRLDVDFDEWWYAQPERLVPLKRFLQFLREVVLERISGKIVIFIDEIDITLGLDFTDDFFAAIRAVYQDRVHNPVFERLTFVLLGVATPDELIADNTQTPFNIGREIALRDFTKEECDLLLQTLNTNYPHSGSVYFEEIYGWTNGHPYLIQKLCKAVLDANEETNSDLVEVQVKRLFLKPEAQSEPNLQFVRWRVSGDSYVREMLQIYRQVLQEREPVQDDEQSIAINKLKLYGLVIVKNRQLMVRNRIYAQVFNLDWVEKTLQETAGLGLPRQYKVIQEIGQGGYATVYLTQYTDEAGETMSMALKLLSPHEKSKEEQNKLIRRFEREARATMRLNHPNIIKIFDSGRSETGRPDEETLYIAMEYMAGGTLRDKLIQEGSLDHNEAFSIIRQVGSALSYAHEQGMIHRDVNPNNILLDTQTDSPRVVLTDFGLVKILEEEHHSHTFTSSPVGTYRYMAPEQWRQEKTTPRTDIYALAITFFETLTGKYPFQYSSAFDLRDKHLYEPIPELSNQLPQLGAFYDLVLAKATAKQAASRYKNVTEFIDALAEAHDKASQAEISARRSRAERTIALARDFIHHDDAEALRMVERALLDYPDYLEALRLKGEIYLKQGEIEKALVSYKQAYERSYSPASIEARDYLNILKQIADMAWSQEERPEAIVSYDKIYRILVEYRGDNEGLQALQTYVYSRLIEYYYTLGQDEADRVLDGKIEANLNIISTTITRVTEAIEALLIYGETERGNELSLRLRNLEIHYYYRQGMIAYAQGEPQDFEQAVGVLEQKIDLLNNLGASDESQRLENKRIELLIKTYKRTIEDTNQRIIEIQEPNEHLVQLYHHLDEAYTALKRLEPDVEAWSEKRKSNLKAQAEVRMSLANEALEKWPKPNYVTALKHYKAIRNIEQLHYPDLSQDLDVDFRERIAWLEKEEKYDERYQRVQSLIDKSDYQGALEWLIQEFIEQKIYEYRDIAQLFWMLIYAQKNNGQYPPPPLDEWKRSEEELIAQLVDRETAFAAIEQELEHAKAELNRHQETTTQLKQKISTQSVEINEQTQALQRSEDKIESLETQLIQTKPNIDRLEQKIAMQSAEINEQVQALQMAKDESDNLEIQLTQAKSNADRQEKRAAIYESKSNQIKQWNIPLIILFSVIAGGVLAIWVPFIPEIIQFMAFLGLIVYVIWIYFITDGNKEG